MAIQDAKASPNQIISPGPAVFQPLYITAVLQSAPLDTDFNQKSLFSAPIPIEQASHFVHIRGTLIIKYYKVSST